LADEKVKTHDVIIIGGGIVGLTTAFHLSKQYPRKSVRVLEKEPAVAQHQTGHNSGVLHSGIYYKPGSLKALNCRQGKKEMETFCERENLPYRICGKVIAAVHESEFDRLEELYQRGLANGVACEKIDQVRLRELEPHCAGIRGIYVSETGIVNYRQVCERLVTRLAKMGQRVYLGVKVLGIKEMATEVDLETTDGRYHCRYVINCAGMHSDRVAALSGRRPPVKIIPFRGEYYQILPEVQDMCNNLIYPVPDPRFPFLGVHFTRMISGHVECGPNAVLALGREGYGKLDINPRDLLETLTYPGFMRMASRFWWTGMGEMWRSYNKSAFVKALQRLIPEITSSQLIEAPAGIRAQAVTMDGALVDDFEFSESHRIVNVLNAPSPAATASFSIGKSIVERLKKRF
jgi:L-2-hydroxyglutarate oxidase